MEINYFDITVVTIVVILGLKGIFNGFFKELFGLIGIIGGIFLASRIGDWAGEYLNEHIFHFDNPTMLKFIGFISVFTVFWISMVTLGHFFKKLSSWSGLGFVDRGLGFIFGASKFFLIGAVITFAVYNIKATRSTLDSLSKTSITFPVLLETGKFLMKIDTTEITKNIDNRVQKASDTIKNNVNKIVKENIEKAQENIKQNTATPQSNKGNK